MTRAIIVGCNGQDGRILWDQLASQQFSLVGISRSGLRVHGNDWADAIDINDAASVLSLVDGFRPDHIYYLAAHHHSSQDVSVNEAQTWDASWRTHVQGLKHFLDAAKPFGDSTRVFYASSSRVYGNPPTPVQTETTPRRPLCLYGITKAAGMMLAHYYREAHGVKVSCGILYNHESPLRSPQFLSQRIALGLAAIKAGRSAHLEIGNLEACVDWGFAPDYTRAMQLILEAETAQDFIVASGETHSVREMIEIAAECIGVDWETHVVEKAQILQRPPLRLCGDTSLLRDRVGWRPNVGFPEMVRIMARAAIAQTDREP